MSKLQGWQFRVDVVAAGLRITASASGGAPTVWVVTASGKAIGGG